MRSPKSRPMSRRGVGTTAASNERFASHLVAAARCHKGGAWVAEARAPTARLG